MTSIDEFIFVLRTSVTKITYRAGIYAFFDWMFFGFFNFPMTIEDQMHKFVL